MDAQLKKGFLDVFVLAALRKEPSYGYKIISDISPYMEISESTLYPILKRLVSAGFLAVESKEHGGRLRKYYSITPSGIERIKGFIDDVTQMNRLYEFILKGDLR